MNHQSLIIDPEARVVMLDAARALRRIGLPASGAFLAAAEELIAKDLPLTRESLADLLHGDAR